MAVFNAILLVWICLSPMSHFTVAKNDPCKERDIRLLLSARDFIEDRETLVELGEAIFPIFEHILADKSANRVEVGRIFEVISVVKADRSRFIETAISKLADPDKWTRRVAVILLGEIGKESDSAPIVALLSDVEVGVGMAAATSLGKIGGPRELAALNIWLAVSKPANELRKYVIESRDALKARLDKVNARMTKP